MIERLILVLGLGSSGHHVSANPADLPEDPVSVIPNQGVPTSASESETKRGAETDWCENHLVCHQRYQSHGRFNITQYGSILHVSYTPHRATKLQHLITDSNLVSSVILIFMGLIRSAQVLFPNINRVNQLMLMCQHPSEATLTSQVKRIHAYVEL